MIWKLLWLFLIYSFAGWVLETVLASLKQKKFANRGIINGPFCLIYGFGGFFITAFTRELTGIWLFLGCAIVASLLEWIAGHLIEMWYHERWWDYRKIKATAIFREGVDMLDTTAMVFEGDRMATLQCGAREISDRMGSIFGTKGYIQVQNINNPEKITVFDKEHKEVAAYLPPAQITGYEYEVEACARAIAQGEKECPEMPHDETVRVMEIMDGIRKSWGYEIPLYE